MFRYRLWVLSFPKGNCSCSSTQKELNGAKQNWQCWILYGWLKKSCTSWGWSFIPGITRFHTSQVVQAFFHQKFSKPVDCRGLRFWDGYFTLLGPKLIEGISSCLQHRGSLCSRQSIFVSKNRENLLSNVNGEQTCLNSTFLWLTNHALER